MKNMFNQIPSKTRQRKWSARMRKKFKVAEFQQLVFRVKVVFEKPMQDAPFDKFMDDFIEFVESNDLCIGALGGKLPIKVTTGVIDSLSKRNVTKEDRKKVSSFLHKHPDVETVTVEELRDANYGWN
jgi:uncharacterized protein YggL (DUF469 family)